MTNPDQKQAPGIYRRRIGDAMVTVINDGYLDMPFELLRGVPLENMHSLMREVFHEGPPRITVNAARRRNRTQYSLSIAGGPHPFPVITQSRRVRRRVDHAKLPAHSS